MKKIFFLALALFPELTFAQTNKYNGYMEEIYIGRQPSPRAEAMGRGHVADNQNDFGSYYNPALTSLSDGLTVNTSFSKNYYGSKTAFYNYFGAAYKLKNIGSFALSKYRFDYGEEFYNFHGTAEPYRIYYDLYTINYSKEITKDIFAGVNININDNHTPNIKWVPSTDKSIVPSFDLGVLKKFRFKNFDNNNSSHYLNLGLSVKNFISSKYTFIESFNGRESADAYLPIIFRLGSSYNFIQRGNRLKNNGEEFSFFVHAEFEKILNTTKSEMYKVGGEFGIYDILFLRMGYVSRNAEITPSVFSYNLGKFTQFTYGAGVKIPLDLIFKMKTPLSIKADYVNSDQPSRNNGSLIVETPHPKFNTISISLNWVPGL